MQFPKNFDLKPLNILKIAGLVLLAIILVALAFRLIGSSITSFLPKTSIDNIASQGLRVLSDKSVNYGGEEMAYDASGSAAGLSVRNVVADLMPSPDGDITPGADAEEFEVTEYSALVETRHLADICSKITVLKSREDVIFENANEYEKSCNYTFKVKKESVPEILSLIEDLDPKELNANTYTIKNLIEDYTSEVEILQKKMTSIEETLASAVAAYDDISRLATRTQDVESLAKIIDSKISIIERLTQAKINIASQLDQISRAKAEQLDRLDYTYFSVNILENKFIDVQNLKDSWKAEIKSFVNDVNKIAQDVTINLAVLLLFALQYLIYIFIILIIAKYTWKLGKRLWLK